MTGTGRGVSGDVNVFILWIWGHKVTWILYMNIDMDK